MNFVKFLRTSSLQNTSGRVLLTVNFFYSITTQKDLAKFQRKRVLYIFQVKKVTKKDVKKSVFLETL